MAAIIVIVVVLASVGGVLAYKNGVFASSSKPTITFSGWVSSGSEYTFDNQMVHNFNQNHTNVSVKFSPISGNYYGNLETKFSSNSAPAVFYIENDELALFSSLGYLQNVTPVLKGNSTYNLNGFLPSIAKQFYYKGGMFAAPKDWGPLIVYFNKNIFNEEKVPYPANITNWNWTTYKNTLQQLNNNRSMLPSSMQKNFSPSVVDPTIDRALVFIHEAGGQWINQQGNGAVTNATQLSGFKAGLKYYYGLYSSGLANLSSNFSAGWAGGDFSNGNVGMIISGLWSVPQLQSNGSAFHNDMSSVGYFHTPTGKQNGTMQFVVGLGVNSKLTGTKKWIADQFLQYFTGPVGEKQWVSLGLAMPARASILHSSWYNNNFPIQSYAGKESSYAFGWNYNTTNFSVVHTNVNNVYKDLFAGNLTFNQAYQKMLTETNSSLAGSSTFSNSVKYSAQQTQTANNISKAFVMPTRER